MVTVATMKHNESWPTDIYPCDDCGSTVDVRHFADHESQGVHSCNLCAKCSGWRP